MQMALPFVPKAMGGGRLFWYVLPVACVLWITLFNFQRPSHVPITITAASCGTTTNSSNTATTNTTTTNNHNNNSTSTSNSKDGVAAVANTEDPCSGRYIYTYDLPSRFNADIVRECATLCRSWTNMTRFVSNAGLGPEVGESEGVFSGSGGWYATDQFALDVIFYNRMKQYACLTNDSSRAAAVFVPFFAGLDIGRHLLGYSTSVRDVASLDLVRWLRSRPEWGVMGGKDHFLVAGRIASDFRRYTDSDSDWGNKLLRLPEAKNMSVLVLESGTWNGSDFSIPYPTYFHPSEDVQVFAWQKRVRRTKRPRLFTFAGAPRPNQTGSIRGRIIEQCRASRRCRLLNCGSNAGDCQSPASVIGAFLNSSFCLQPPGDSFTRRSAFDSMVTGCVPVFFHPGSAYEQYLWHLPKNHSSYSVFIAEEEVRQGKVSIEERLAGIPEGEVRAMREEVIKMIPRLVYADPRAASRVSVKDAFEVAMEGVIERVGRFRKEMTGEVTAPPHTNAP